jgi:hypothetical protein
MLKTASPGLAACCVMALAATPLPAAEFSSAYTPLKLNDCKLLKTGGEEA